MFICVWALISIFQSKRDGKVGGGDDQETSNKPLFFFQEACMAFFINSRHGLKR